MCVCWVGWGVAVICAQAYARARVCVCVCTTVERGVRGEVRVGCYNWTRPLKSCSETSGFISQFAQAAEHCGGSRQNHISVHTQCSMSHRR